MFWKKMRKTRYLTIVIVLLMIFGCSSLDEFGQFLEGRDEVILVEEEKIGEPTVTFTSSPSPWNISSTEMTPVLEPTLEPADEMEDVTERIQTKWDLWNSGETLLRGANIWQAVVIPELDGLEFKGPGPVGPPFSQEDFNRLAALGANYVTISGPGLYSETPPFEPDLEIASYLDELLEMIEKADLFAVISFRTGPGRSEYYLCCSGEADYFGDYFNDTMWEDSQAQDAWIEMWQYTAEKYRNNPIVVGYKLMVEPNSNDMYFDIWEPEEFYAQQAGSTYDWNQLYPGIVEGIRQVDENTPILINANGYSAVEWLPYMEVLNAEKIVYIAHQYAPYEYTNQSSTDFSYPSSMDTDWDGDLDDFSLAWLEDLMAVVEQFQQDNDVPVGIDEFGVARWAPGAAAYMDDLMSVFEEQGVNYALWEWSTGWEDFVEEVNDFTYQYGPDPDNQSEVANELLDVILKYWSLNIIRPSNTTWNREN